MTLSLPHQALKIIKEKAPHFNGKLAIILGSGMSQIADSITQRIEINYDQLPGFPSEVIAGHHAKLILGELSGKPVACMQGRVHRYQGNGADEIIKNTIRTLKLLGCETLITTNTGGSLNENIAPGDIVFISDHINLQGNNPLVGTNDDDFGPRFLAMDDAYDATLRDIAKRVATELHIKHHEGIYLATLGPLFETPAEIRLFRKFGADVVGMSTVPDTIIAHHCGMKILVISAIANFAAGMTDEKLSHENTLRYGAQSANNVLKIIQGIINHL